MSWPLNEPGELPVNDIAPAHSPAARVREMLARSGQRPAPATALSTRLPR